jgi:DNA-directed RNA polymerase subunit RPC12/RpoP
MKNWQIVLLSFLNGLLLLIPDAVYALEEAELDIRMRRDFGYGLGSDVQGTFSLRISSTEELVKVIFLIDDEVFAETHEPPFHVQFQTNNYDPGVHTLMAVGYTQDGREIYSRQIRANFLSAEAARTSFLKIIIPILGIIIGVSIISFIGPLLFGRKKTVTQFPDTPISYGLFGGAICKKCQKPFSIQGWGPNLMIGKLNRCPNCGKWGLVKRAHPTDLAKAETGELDREDTVPQSHTVSEEERLRKEISDSRYQDL